MQNSSIEDLVRQALAQVGSGVPRDGRLFSETLIDLAKKRLADLGEAIDPARKPTDQEAENLSKLKGALDKVISAQGNLDGFASPSPHPPYPPINASMDVAYVLGTWKDIDPRKIAMNDHVSDYKMAQDECAGMGYLLDLYYKERQFKLSNGLIQPFETERAFGGYVGFFAGVVLQHNPYR